MKVGIGCQCHTSIESGFQFKNTMRSRRYWKEFLIFTLLTLFGLVITAQTEDDSEAVKSREKRSGMLSSPLDLEAVRRGVISPMTISNQFSATFGFNGIRLVGWTLGGKNSK